MGEVTITALDNTNFSIEKGELVVIVGPSGAGKTTSLNILGGMDTASSGKVIVDEKRIDEIIKKPIVTTSDGSLNSTDVADIKRELKLFFESYK